MDDELKKELLTNFNYFMKCKIYKYNHISFIQTRFIKFLLKEEIRIVWLKLKEWKKYVSDMNKLLFSTKTLMMNVKEHCTMLHNDFIRYLYETKYVFREDLMQKSKLFVSQYEMNKVLNKLRKYDLILR